jgi:hypothetical protein
MKVATLACILRQLSSTLINFELIQILLKVDEGFFNERGNIRSNFMGAGQLRKLSWKLSLLNSHANSRFSTFINSHANFRFSTLMQTLASQLSSTLMQTFASHLSSTLMQTLASQLSCKLSLLNFHQRSCKLSLLNSQQISSKITNGISYICVAGIRGQQ